MPFKANKEAKLVESSLLHVGCRQLGKVDVTPVQRLTPALHPQQSRGKNFYVGREKLIFSSKANLFHFLRPVLRIVVAHVMATIWSSCS